MKFLKESISKFFCFGGGGGGCGGRGARVSELFYKESPNLRFFFLGGGGGGVDGRSDQNQSANSPLQGQQLCKIILKSMH